jgi:hypothetical protein
VKTIKLVALSSAVLIAFAGVADAKVRRDPREGRYLDIATTSLKFGYGSRAMATAGFTLHNRLYNITSRRWVATYIDTKGSRTADYVIYFYRRGEIFYCAAGSLNTATRWSPRRAKPYGHGFSCRLGFFQADRKRTAWITVAARKGQTYDRTNWFYLDH